MPKHAKGDVRFSGGIWRARITLIKKRRHDVPLPGCQSREEAEERALVLAEQAKAMRFAGKFTLTGPDTAAVGLLEELGRAATGEAVTDAIHVIGEFCGAPTLPKRLEGPTFSEVAKRWTSGELARQWPDHVKSKDALTDERRLTFLASLDVGGIALGAVPIYRFKLDHAEQAMRQLPESAKRPATRRHYAQVLRRVLELAVYPLRLLGQNPIPKGFMPKAGKPPAFSFLYPAEDAALMALESVPVLERLLFGVAGREGMRASELLALTWRDVDLDRGVITLDRNKTDDARAWALDLGVCRALARRWELTRPRPTARVFDASGLEPDKLAKLLRTRLWEAGVRRPELHESGENRGRLRAHDLRGTFVTLALAAGRSEAWVQDRTGHTTSAMLNRYRRAARSAAELGLGSLKSLDDAIPELRAPGPIAQALPTAPIVLPSNDPQSSLIPLARPKGLEPLTGGLEIHCSIQLSYGRVWAVKYLKMRRKPTEF